MQQSGNKKLMIPKQIIHWIYLMEKNETDNIWYILQQKMVRLFKLVRIRYPLQWKDDKLKVLSSQFMLKTCEKRLSISIIVYHHQAFLYLYSTLVCNIQSTLVSWEIQSNVGNIPKYIAISAHIPNSCILSSEEFCL